MASLTRKQLRAFAWELAQAMDEAELARRALDAQDLADDLAACPPLAALLAQFPPAQHEGPSRLSAQGGRHA